MAGSLTSIVPITAIVPAHHRLGTLRRTLLRIGECVPPPAELLVHLDGGSDDVRLMLQAEFPQVRVLLSETLLGPGGARNRLIAEATHELVANFDDDSFPSHRDYFERVSQTATRFPDAAVISSASRECEWLLPEFQQIAIFSGCGCVFRKSWFQRIQGFVPLPVAYVMEEVDVSLQLHAIGGMIVHDPGLRVIHDHPADEDRDMKSLNEIVLANTALFPFLRFPVWLLPLGLWQVFSRLVYLIRQGWAASIPAGLRMLPCHLWSHCRYRKVIAGKTVLSWLRLRRCPQSLGPSLLPVGLQTPGEIHVKP